MKVFDLFVSKYPPGNDLRKPTAETLEQFQGKVPAELLNFWQEYGFGNYGGGLLKIIDPTDYIDTLTLWLGEQEGCLPILMTGFGTLLFTASCLIQPMICACLIFTTADRAVSLPAFPIFLSVLFLPKILRRSF